MGKWQIFFFKKKSILLNCDFKGGTLILLLSFSDCYTISFVYKKIYLHDRCIF